MQINGRDACSTAVDTTALYGKRSPLFDRIRTIKFNDPGSVADNVFTPECF